MTVRRKYNPARKDEVFSALRREILAARLKVALDEQLNRETSPEVLSLALMDLPPVSETNDVVIDSAVTEASETKRHTGWGFSPGFTKHRPQHRAI